MCVRVMGDKLIFAARAAVETLDAGDDDSDAIIAYLRSMVTVDTELWQKNFQLVTAVPAPNIATLRKQFETLIADWEADGTIGTKDKAATAIPLLARHCTRMVASGFTLADPQLSYDWEKLCLLYTRHLYHLFVNNSNKRLIKERAEAVATIDSMLNERDAVLLTEECRTIVHRMGSPEQIQLVNEAHNVREVEAWYTGMFGIQDYETYRASLAGEKAASLETNRLPILEKYQETLEQTIAPAAQPAVLSVTIKHEGIGVPLSTAPQSVVYGQNFAFVADAQHPGIVLVAAKLGITFDGGIFTNAALATIDAPRDKYGSYNSGQNNYTLSNLECGTVTELERYIQINAYFTRTLLPLHDCALYVSDKYPADAQFYPLYRLCLLAHHNKLVGLFLYRFPVPYPAYAEKARASFQEVTRRINLLRAAIAYYDYNPYEDNGAALLRRVHPITGRRAVDMSLEDLVDPETRAKEVAAARLQYGLLDRQIAEHRDRLQQVQEAGKNWNLKDLKENFPELFTEEGTVKKKTKERQGKITFDKWVPANKMTGDIARAYIIEKYLPDKIKKLVDDRQSAQERVDFYSLPIYENLPWHSAAETYEELIRMKKESGPKYYDSDEEVDEQEASSFDQDTWDRSLGYLADNWPDFVRGSL